MTRFWLLGGDPGGKDHRQDHAPGTGGPEGHDVVEDRGRDTCGHAFTSARATRVGRQGQDGLPHR